MARSSFEVDRVSLPILDICWTTSYRPMSQCIPIEIKNRTMFRQYPKCCLVRPDSLSQSNATFFNRINHGSASYMLGVNTRDRDNWTPNAVFSTNNAFNLY